MRRHTVILLSLFHAVWFTSVGSADDDGAPDAVVVPYGAPGQIDDLAALADSVSEHLRSEGVSLLHRPGQAFERVGSRAPRTVDTTSVESLVAAMADASSGKNLERVGQLAYELMAKSEVAPESVIDGKGSVQNSLRYALLQACFDGVSAFHRLNKVMGARRLIEYCSSLPWLVARDADVRPDVRAVLLRDIKAYDFDLSASGSTGKAWLQGAPFALGKSKVRTLPGARLAVMVDCGSASRVHWVVAGESTTALRVDCAFDAAVHSDDRGVWLSSPPENLVAHGLELARVLGATRVVLVGKEADRYVLRAHAVNGGRSAFVTLPLVHGDRHLTAAVDELVQTKESGTLAVVPSTQPAPPATGKPSWMRWSGASALALGLGGEVAGWFLYRARAEKGEELATRLPGYESSVETAWKDARAPMLGVAAAGAGLGVAGVSLLLAGESDGKASWWLAGVGGGAGAALAAWGAVDLAKGQSCSGDEVSGCVAAEQRRDRGALLLMNAVPLLVVPVVVLVRTKRGPKNLRVSARLQGLQLAGSW